MTPSEQKFLFVLVRDVLHRGSDDQIEVKRHGNKHIPALRSLGYLEGNGLTENAFQRYFDTFELVSCPPHVQQLVDSFGIEIRWRRPHGIIEDKLDRAGGGSSYRNLRTVFVRKGAGLETWYQEFGHILYGCIKNTPDIFTLFKDLQRQALVIYPVVTDQQVKEETALAPGRYVLINRRYHGLDHSGDEADELWAVLFGTYQIQGELNHEIHAPVEEIIAAIRALPKPLDPCDKD